MSKLEGGIKEKNRIFFLKKDADWENNAGYEDNPLEASSPLFFLYTKQEVTLGWEGKED